MMHIGVIRSGNMGRGSWIPSKGLQDRSPPLGCSKGLGDFIRHMMGVYSRGAYGS